MELTHERQPTFTRRENSGYILCSVSSFTFNRFKKKSSINQLTIYNSHGFIQNAVQFGWQIGLTAIFSFSLFVYIVSKSSVDGLVRIFFYTLVLFGWRHTAPAGVKQGCVIIMGFKNKPGTCTCIQKSRFDCHNFICNLKPTAGNIENQRAN